MLVTMTFAVWFLGRVAGPGLLGPHSQAFTCLSSCQFQVPWTLQRNSGEAPLGQEGRLEHSEETQPPEKAIK